MEPQNEMMEPQNEMMEPPKSIWEVMIEMSWVDAHGYRQHTDEPRVVYASDMEAAIIRAIESVREQYGEGHLRAVNVREVYAGGDILVGR